MIRATPARDQPVVRAGLRAILQPFPEISGVGDAGDDAEAPARTHALAPAMVRTDIRMPGREPRGGRKARACFPAAP
jgi:DNA-binding NarL/FixJ family response regulator